MPRKKQEINDLLRRDYFSKDEIKHFIFGDDYKSRKDRDEIYRTNEKQLCDKVDMTDWIKVFNSKMTNRLLRVNCMRNLKSGIIIFMENNKPKYIVYALNNKWVIRHKIKGLPDCVDVVRSFQYAMNLCISKLI